MARQKMKIQLQFLFGLILLSSVIVAAQTSASDKPASASAQPKKKNALHVAADDSGEKKFQQNCGRCHTAPEQFPSRITGTIVTHMRVRASLSEKDARDILKFLAP
jgi:mono/diheme cytochrome c family protein